MPSKTFSIKPYFDKLSTTKCKCCKDGIHVYALNGAGVAEDWVYDQIYKLAKYGGAVSITVTLQNKRVQPTRRAGKTGTSKSRARG